MCCITFANLVRRSAFLALKLDYEAMEMNGCERRIFIEFDQRRAERGALIKPTNLARNEPGLIISKLLHLCLAYCFFMLLIAPVYKWIGPPSSQLSSGEYFTLFSLCNVIINNLFGQIAYKCVFI